MKKSSHNEKVQSGIAIINPVILLIAVLFTGCSDSTPGNTPSLSISDVNMPEGDSGSTSFDFQFMLSEPSSRDVTIEYHTEDGTATAGTDYDPVETTLVIPAGEVSATISVNVIGDTEPEPDETFSVLVSSVTNADISTDRGTATILNDDQLSVTIDDQTIAEPDDGSTTTMFFTVSLSSPPQEQVTVDYVSEDRTASSPDDYEPSSGTIVFETGKQTQTIGVRIIGDDLYEGNETFNIRLTNSDQATIQKDLGTGTIENNDSPPILTISSAQLSEADCQTSMEFDLQLDTQSGLAVSMEYQTADDTATLADNDYQAASGSITIEPGELNSSIPVTINCDDKGEPDETFILYLSNITGATPDTPQAIGTIINDDGPATMSISDTSVEEGDSGITLMTFMVALSQPLSTDEQVNFTTVDGTATSLSGDYNPTNGTLTIAAGQTEGIIQVEILGDSVFEADEIVNMVLSNSTSVEITDSEAKGTILNDDEPPVISISAPVQAEGNSGMSTFVFAVSLSAAEQLDASIQYETQDGTAMVSDGDYQRTTGTVIIPAGSTTATNEVPVAGDTRYEQDETFMLNLVNSTHATISQAQATATIVNDDTIPQISISSSSAHEGENGQTSLLTFTLSLSSISGMDVSVDYSTSDYTASAAGGDYQSTSGTVDIPAGSTNAQLQVMVYGDHLFEPDESFFMDLSNPLNATISATRATGTIINDDPMQTLTIDDQSVDESAQSITFNITLSAPEGVDVPFDYATSDGTATSLDNDFESTNGSGVIPAGQTTASVSVPIHDDQKYESDETFTLEISLPSAPAVAILSDGTGQATIIDDDSMPALYVNDVSLTEGDSGTSNMEFSVSLSTTAGVNVTVDYASSDGTATSGQDYSQVTGTLSILAGATTGTVSVPIFGDDWYEGDEELFLVIANPTNASISDDTGIGTVNNDDSQPRITIQIASAEEGDAGLMPTMSFPVQLSNPSGFDVGLDFETSDGTASTSDNDYVPAWGTIHFAPGTTSQQIEVTVVGDDLYEPDEQFNLDISNPTLGYIGVGRTIGTIMNDDRAWYFVDPTGDDSDGMSWQTAFNTVQQGMDAAGLAGGGDVWVAAGTYTNAGGTGTVLEMKSGVYIYGGFEGYAAGTGAQETLLQQRDWERNPTILDGQTIAYHVVEGANDALIDGFTITNGNATGSDYPQGYGGGMLNNSSSTDISHCKFTGNVAQLGGAILNQSTSMISIRDCLFSNNHATSGAAIMNIQSSPTIDSCTFDSNTSPSNTQSAIVYNMQNSAPVITACSFSNNNKTVIMNSGNTNGSQPTITDCIFQANYGPDHGGAMYNFNSSPVIERCYFWSNSSDHNGGAIENYTASPTVTNCVFSGNSTSANGGAMSNRENSFPVITSCSFYANSADKGGAISNDNSATYVSDSILWGNFANTDPTVHNTNIFRTPNWSYSDVQGCGGSGSSWSMACGWNAGGNIDDDPLFADPDGPDGNPGNADDDLSLDSGSPCIDAADGDIAAVTDILGMDRYDDPSVTNTGSGTPDYSDMGAYEAQ